MTPEDVQRLMPGLPALLGLTITRAERDVVVAELLVRPELCTLGDTIHGGTIMAFADTVGAVGTVMNLREGQGTTTIESKTNFFAGAKLGTLLTAESVPLHRGRRTQVWENSHHQPGRPPDRQGDADADGVVSREFRLAPRPRIRALLTNPYHGRGAAITPRGGRHNAFLHCR